MNNQQRNEPCHCGSGKKYKNCCLKKDEAVAQLSKVQHDVRRVVTPNMGPYIFWKRWSAACQRDEFGLVYNLLLSTGPMRAKFTSDEDFFVNLKNIGLPFAPVWNLEKMKLTETSALFLVRRVDDEDKNADISVALMTLRKTQLGWRVENIEQKICKPSKDFLLSFGLFDIKSTEHDYLVKCREGWVRPELADANELHFDDDDESTEENSEE